MYSVKLSYVLETRSSNFGGVPEENTSTNAEYSKKK